MGQMLTIFAVTITRSLVHSKKISESNDRSADEILAALNAKDNVD